MPAYQFTQSPAVLDALGVAIVPPCAGLTALRLILTGRVQGLGVRPAIYQLAVGLGLRGSVRNTSRGVEIEIEGSNDAVLKFASTLTTRLPAAAHVTRLIREEIEPAGCTEFVIIRQSTPGPLMAPVPEDRAVCPECVEDIERRNDRRYRYPLTSCTQCGPRYTVIRAMPFERDATSMDQFPMCTACRGEYEQPGDRRFHAQTIACPECGPEVWATSVEGNERLIGNDAIRSAVATLKAGKIVGLRGLGGYQLLVDATNDNAVMRLRDRKKRRAKPLAVMVASSTMAEQLARFGDAERAAFNSPAAPIVLVHSKANNGLTPAIAPQLDEIGLMRPTTPLHAMLAGDVGRPLVCTSANREGDPLEYEVEDAEGHLADICDVWLHHNRPIERPIDDSVVRVIGERPVSIRLARGLAPLTLDLPDLPPTLAVGGFLKAAMAWSNGAQATLGPHLGDQQSLAARQRWVDQMADWQRLYNFVPELIVHDMHPEYFSTQWARSQSVPTIAVQHHHAHIVAGMLEHGLLGHCVLGVAWDGTGYGTDATIWGGEFLLADDVDFKRVAHLKPFCLPGGEAAIREPWRIAIAMCHSLDDPTIFDWWLRQIDSNALATVRKMATQPHLSPRTTSAGRLIDAAAAVILGIERVDFEGEAAMRLEAIADRRASGAYDFPILHGNTLRLDWRPLFAGLANDCRRRIDPPTLAMRFHRTLAQGIARVCRTVREWPIVLSGGVFQNRLLTELVIEELDDRSVYLPGIIPPNDGGIAAGQLAVAAARLRRSPCV